MSLIDRDENRETFMSVVYDELSSDTDNDRANRIISAFDSMKEVDAVKVVRCCECRYSDTKRLNIVEQRYLPEILFCRNGDWCGDEPLACRADDFCSYGERKECET